MKKVKKLSCLVVAAFILLGNTIGVAAAVPQPSEFEYLKNAIATINAVPVEDTNQYIEDNHEWIDEIGERLDAYVATIPEDEQNDMVTKLLGGNPLSRSGNLDEYFDYTEYHYRGGYWTYSMEPKLAVRLWKPTMVAAWEELEDSYYGIRNDNGSLWNQYLCHWDYDAFGVVAGIWDLEQGRPLVDYSEMFAALCNP